MANRKITELNALTGANAADTDVFAVVDVSADETKKITLGEFKNALDTGSGFVRITGDTMTGDLGFGDNDKAIFGAGSDLQIYHDGANSYIKNNTGVMRIHGTQVQIKDEDNNETLAVFNPQGSVDLYYDNSKKLATTSTGIDVTGTVTADGLTVDGNTFKVDGSTNRVSVGTTTTYIGNDFTVGATSPAIVLDNGAGTILAQFSSAGIATNDVELKALRAGNLTLGTNNTDRLNIASNGDISFYEDTGTTPKFFWDASAESLGIGTSSIDYTAAGRTVVHVEGSAGALLAMEDTGARSYFFQSGNDLFVENDTASGSMIFGTNASTERLRITSAGNVGIGTSSPEAKVEIQDGSDSKLRLQTTSGTDRKLNIGITSSTNAVINVESNHALEFHTNNTEAMRIDSSGNLLVGQSSTTFPGATNTTTGHSFRDFGGAYHSASSNPSLSLNRNTTDGDIVQFRKNGTTVGSIGIESSGFVVDGEGNHAGLKMFLGSIGPRQNGSDVDATIDLGWSGGRFKDLHLSGGVSLDGSSGNTLYKSGSDLVLNNRANATMIFGTNNTERMRIDSSGNVGIGTSSPSGSGLHIKKDTASTTNELLRLSNSAGSTTDGVKLVMEVANTSGNGGEIGTVRDGGSFNPYMYFSTSAGVGSSPSERMRIDSSGNLLVGHTSAFSPIGNGGSGVTATASGQLFAGHAGPPLYVNREDSDGDIAVFRKDGTTVGSIGTVSSRLHLVNGDTGLRFAGDADAIWPCNGSGGDRDNAIDLGSSGIRFDDIYATNGTIQTSDRNEKQDIEVLSDAETRVAQACKGLLRKFRWQDAVAEKGDDARIHFGIIAQDLQDAFAAEGLDAGRYAMFISSTWWETQTDVPAVEAVYEDVVIPAVLDEEGNELEAERTEHQLVTEAVEAKEAYTRTDTYETQEEAPEGATERTRLGVRYPELLAFIIAAI